MLEARVAWKKSLDNVRIYKETTLELTAPEFSMGNTNTIFDPYASAELMLRESKSMFKSDKVGWYMQHNSKESSIESRILDEDRCVHRVSAVLESGLNISRVFQALTSESFVASLYPVRLEDVRSTFIICMCLRRFLFVGHKRLPSIALS